MTEKQAIRLSMSIWHWLAVTGDALKEDHPRYYEDDSGDMEARCPCCEYYNGAEWEGREDNKEGNVPCGACPLQHCGENSAYRNWVHLKEEDDREERKELADQVYRKLEKYYFQKWGT